MRRFIRMAEVRSEILRIHLATHWKQRYIAEIPMTFVGVGKGVNLPVLILISSSVAKFRDWAQLHHCVGHRCTGKDQSSLHPPRGCESDVCWVGERCRTQKGVDVVHRSLFGVEARGDAGQE